MVIRQVYMALTCMVIHVARSEGLSMNVCVLLAGDYVCGLVKTRMISVYFAL